MQASEAGIFAGRISRFRRLGNEGRLNEMPRPASPGQMGMRVA